MRQTPPTPAMRYFGNVAADPVVGQRRPQLLAMSHPVPLTSSKPFENAVRQPTLSPYLSLNLIENETGLPNYHAWVRPQVRQRETDRERSFQTRRQQRKLQAVDASSQVSPNRGGQVPTTDGTSRFLNLGSYFPGLRK